MTYRFRCSVNLRLVDCEEDCRGQFNLNCKLRVTVVPFSVILSYFVERIGCKLLQIGERTVCIDVVAFVVSL